MNPFLMIFFNNLCSERILSQLLPLQKRKLCTFRDSVFEIPMPFSSTGSEYGRLKLKNYLLIWSKYEPQPMSSMRNCSNISAKS